MKPTILCYGCMHDIGTGLVCPHCGWEKGTQAQLTQHLPPGSILNQRYLIGRVLGQGGFGVTYIAWDEVLNLRLAIKEYLPNGIATRNYGNPDVTLYPSEDLKEQYVYGLSRFIDEARALARFSSHPNIVTVRDYFEANNTAYLVMDYIEGITYKEYLKLRGNQISIEETMGVSVPIMNALEKIHSAGLLHRDISPDNIYITHENEVVLLDFGAARYALGDKSKSFSVILKAGYAPEEQYRSRGLQGPFTDIYALGATIYRSITGQVPPDALDRSHDDILKPPSYYGIALPGDSEAVIMKALAIMAKDRYQTVEELRTALIALVPEVKAPDFRLLPEANNRQIIQAGTLKETVNATSLPNLSAMEGVTEPMKKPDSIPHPPINKNQLKVSDSTTPQGHSVNITRIVAIMVVVVLVFVGVVAIIRSGIIETPTASNKSSTNIATSTPSSSSSSDANTSKSSTPSDNSSSITSQATNNEAVSNKGAFEPVTLGGISLNDNIDVVQMKYGAPTHKDEQNYNQDYHCWYDNDTFTVTYNRATGDIKSICSYSSNYVYGNGLTVGDNLDTMYSELGEPSFAGNPSKMVDYYIDKNTLKPYSGSLSSPYWSLSFIMSKGNIHQIILREMP